MTNTSKPRASGLASRVVLWLAVAIMVALGSLGIVAAVRANPLKTAAEEQGVSKYLFLNECKNKLSEQIRGVIADADVEFLPPGQIVPAVQPRQGGGWTWTSAVLVSSASNGGAGQAQFTCEHDKATGETNIVNLQ